MPTTSRVNLRLSVSFLSGEILWLNPLKGTPHLVEKQGGEPRVFVGYREEEGRLNRSSPVVLVVNQTWGVMLRTSNTPAKNVTGKVPVRW